MDLKYEEKQAYRKIILKWIHTNVVFKNKILRIPVVWEPQFSALKLRFSKFQPRLAKNCTIKIFKESASNSIFQYISESHYT